MALFFLPSFHLGMNYMLTQWAIGFCLLSAFFAWVIKRHFGWLQGVTALYILLSAVYIYSFRENRYAGNSQYQMYLQTSCFFAMMAFVLMAVFAMTAPIEKITRWIPLYTALNAAYVVIGAVFKFGKLPQGTGISGVLDYSGMNGVLLALGIPFILHAISDGLRVYWISFALAIIAIVLSKASVPYGVVALGIGAFYLHRGQKLAWLAGVPVLTGAIIHSHLFGNAAFLHDSYRFKAYKTFMGAWWESANHWFGTGPGTFPVIAPVIQVQRHFMVDVDSNHNSFFWLWIHSDILQALFEYGIIGFILIGLSYGQVCTRLWRGKDAAMFSLAVMILGSAMFDYPLRYEMTAFFITLVVATQRQKETTCINL